MYIQKNKTLYRCSHCNKYYIQERHAVNHEKFCYHNPENKTACFNDCSYLKHTHDEHEGHEFYCTEHNKAMYSYRLFKTSDEQYIKAIVKSCYKMPKECKDYQYKY